MAQAARAAEVVDLGPPVTLRSKMAGTFVDVRKATTRSLRHADRVVANERIVATFTALVCTKRASVDVLHRKTVVPLTRCISDQKLRTN